MSDYHSSLPIYTRIGDYVTIAGYDGTDEIRLKVDSQGRLDIIATDLDIRNLSQASDSILIYGFDGTTNQKIAVNNAGRLQVDVVSGGGGGYQYQDNVSQTGVYGNVILGGDGTNVQIVKVDNQGELQVDILSIAAGTNIIGKVYLTDGTNDVGITATGELKVNIAAQSLGAVKISKDANPNSETNPIFVKVVDVALANEIHDYNTAVNVAKDASDNHDYVISSGKKFLLRKVLASASGAMKIEIQVGPSASLQTKAVLFTSQANPNAEIEFTQPIEVQENGGGERVRIIRTNRERQSMDVYSTIMGTEI